MLNAVNVSGTTAILVTLPIAECTAASIAALLARTAIGMNVSPVTVVVDGHVL